MELARLSRHTFGLAVRMGYVEFLPFAGMLTDILAVGGSSRLSCFQYASIATRNGNWRQVLDTERWRIMKGVAYCFFDTPYGA